VGTAAFSGGGLIDDVTSVTVNTSIYSVTYPSIWGIDAFPSPANTLTFRVPEVYYIPNKVTSNWDITMSFTPIGGTKGDPYTVEYTLRYYYQ
jgi:hypothetical protein